MEKSRIHTDKMSESSSSDSDLEKDDEDLLEKLESKKSKSDKDEKDKEEISITEKSAKKSADLTDPVNPIFHILHKHKRSFDSADNSNDSFERQKTKKKKKELTQFQKSYIESQEEDFEKNFKILKEDFKFLEEGEKKFFKDTNLDLMFIMDLTGSMGMWLNEAKQNINNIINEITENNPGSKIRVSYVGYKDFSSIGEERKYSSKEFTENIKEITDYINTLTCSGGGDIPEDIVGALKHALKMNWESEAKYAILVCDAPCHGKQYHTISYDRFPNGDPDGTTLESIMEQMRLKGITFYCLEIDSSTEKMFSIMEKVYNNNKKFHIEKLWNSTEFSFFVSFSASVILGNEKYNKLKFKDLVAKYRKESIENIMKKYINNDININYNDNLDLDLINQIENMQLGGEDRKLFDFINRMNDLNINNAEKNNIDDNNNNNNSNEINNNNFIEIKLNKDTLLFYNERNINYIIRGITYNKNPNSVNDWVNPTIQELEFKTNIYIFPNNYNENYTNKEYNLKIFDNILDKEKNGIIPFKINKEYYNNSLAYLKHLYYDELICQQIGDYFNILLKEKLPYCSQYIKFPRHVIYELDVANVNIDSEELITEHFKNNYRYIITEDTIQLNFGINMEKRTLQSFSHFSYQISGGQLLITDLEYDNDSRKIIKYNIYRTKNGGYQNIMEFFASHICNNTCKSLELIHPRKKINNPLSKAFFQQKYILSIKLCKCCGVPILLNKDKNDDLEFSCDICECSEIATKYKEKCIKCQSEYTYSTHVYNCKLQNYPKCCSKCLNMFYS